MTVSGYVTVTVSFPFVLVCHNYYELMVAQGEGRSPMTSSDAETDSKPIIIIIIINGVQSPVYFPTYYLSRA